MRWMLSSCCLLLFLVPARASAPAYGYLYQSAYSLDGKPRLPAEPYSPQIGDLLLRRRQPARLARASAEACELAAGSLGPDACTDLIEDLHSSIEHIPRTAELLRTPQECAVYEHRARTIERLWNAVVVSERLGDGYERSREVTARVEL